MDRFEEVEALDTDALRRLAEGRSASACGRSASGWGRRPGRSWGPGPASELLDLLRRQGR